MDRLLILGYGCFDATHRTVAGMPHLLATYYVVLGVRNVGEMQASRLISSPTILHLASYRLVEYGIVILLESEEWV